MTVAGGRMFPTIGSSPVSGPQSDGGGGGGAGAAGSDVPPFQLRSNQPQPSQQPQQFLTGNGVSAGGSFTARASHASPLVGTNPSGRPTQAFNFRSVVTAATATAAAAAPATAHSPAHANAGPRLLASANDGMAPSNPFAQPPNTGTVATASGGVSNAAIAAAASFRSKSRAATAAAAGAAPGAAGAAAAAASGTKSIRRRPVIFDRRTRYDPFPIGTRLDVLFGDESGSGSEWCIGTVIRHQLASNQICIHYDDTPPSYDEWLSAISERLAPLHTHTVAPSRSHRLERENAQAESAAAAAATAAASAAAAAANDAPAPDAYSTSNMPQSTATRPTHWKRLQATMKATAVLKSLAPSPQQRAIATATGGSGAGAQATISPVTSNPTTRSSSRMDGAFPPQPQPLPLPNGGAAPASDEVTQLRAVITSQQTYIRLLQSRVASLEDTIRLAGINPALITPTGAGGASGGAGGSQPFSFGALNTRLPSRVVSAQTSPSNAYLMSITGGGAGIPASSPLHGNLMPLPPHPQYITSPLPVDGGPAAQFRRSSHETLRSPQPHPHPTASPYTPTGAGLVPYYLQSPTVNPFVPLSPLPAFGASPAAAGTTTTTVGPFGTPPLSINTTPGAGGMIQPPQIPKGNTPTGSSRPRIILINRTPTGSGAAALAPLIASTPTAASASASAGAGGSSGGPERQIMFSPTSTSQGVSSPRNQLPPSPLAATTSGGTVHIRVTRPPLTVSSPIASGGSGAAGSGSPSSSFVNSPPMATGNLSLPHGAAAAATGSNGSPGSNSPLQWTPDSSTGPTPPRAGRPPSGSATSYTRRRGSLSIATDKPGDTATAASPQSSAASSEATPVPAPVKPGGGGGGATILLRKPPSPRAGVTVGGSGGGTASAGPSGPGASSATPTPGTPRTPGGGKHGCVVSGCKQKRISKRGYCALHQSATAI